MIEREDGPTNAALSAENVRPLLDASTGGAGSSREPLPKGFGTPCDVLFSKFTIVQVVFNAISSVVMSLFLFWLLFVLIGGGGPYEWCAAARVAGPASRAGRARGPGAGTVRTHAPTHPRKPPPRRYHPNLIGVVLGSVLLVTPTSVMALAPAGLPEAVEKGWFYRVDPATASPALLRWMPFLRTAPRWRCGLKRHAMLGLWLSPLFVPLPIILARLCLGEVIDTWTLIWFNIGFETVLSVPCTALGLLAFAMEPNFARVKATMSMHRHPVKRLGYRIVGCAKLLC